ncbi:MAG: efflux RND transporter periplasmic adaptor subunit [Prevotella sp.]|nr:efflux RND transporter periplasmic adaptor subunit [Prevotella sp.]
MKTIKTVMAMMVLLALYSCGNKSKSAEEQTVRVKVEQIHTEAVNGEQGFSGTIEESTGSLLSFDGTGTIKHIYVTAGQTVRQGQLIAELDATKMQNAYTIAKTSREQAEDTYNRMKELHEAGSLPEMQWIQVDNQLKSAKAAEALAQKSLADTRLYAPFSGYIAAKVAEAGQNAVPGVPVVKLVSIGSVKVKIAVPEDDIQRIKKGSSMKIIVPALKNRTFSGMVTERGVSADPRSRTYEVKATIMNSDGQLLPGMICQAFTNYMQGTTGVFVPADLVQLDDDNKTFVWVVNNGRAVKRQIIISSETAQGAQISGGLSAGDQIIIAGQQKVSNGMKVEIVK